VAAAPVRRRAEAAQQQLLQPLASDVHLKRDQNGQRSGFPDAVMCMLDIITAIAVQAL
jgi:hypothetical protein